MWLLDCYSNIITYYYICISVPLYPFLFVASAGDSDKVKPFDETATPSAAKADKQKGVLVTDTYAFNEAFT